MAVDANVVGSIRDTFISLQIGQHDHATRAASAHREAQDTRRSLLTPILTLAVTFFPSASLPQSLRSKFSHKVRCFSRQPVTHTKLAYRP